MKDSGLTCVILVSLLVLILDTSNEVETSPVPCGDDLPFLGFPDLLPHKQKKDPSKDKDDKPEDDKPKDNDDKKNKKKKMEAIEKLLKDLADYI